MKLNSTKGIAIIAIFIMIIVATVLTIQIVEPERSKISMDTSYNENSVQSQNNKKVLAGRSIFNSFEITAINNTNQYSVEPLYNVEYTIKPKNGLFWTPDSLYLKIVVTDMNGDNAFCNGLIVEVICHDKPSANQHEKFTFDLSKISVFEYTIENGWNAVQSYDVIIRVGDYKYYSGNVLV